MSLGTWWHQLRNPHCEHCLEIEHEKREQAKEDKVCPSCETLKEMLAVEKNEKAQLLRELLREPPISISEAPPVNNDIESLKPRVIPWRIKQQMLEEKSRVDARILKEKQKEIAQTQVETKTTEQLEKEVLS